MGSVVHVYENEDIKIVRYAGPDRKAGKTLLDRRRWQITHKNTGLATHMSAVDFENMVDEMTISLRKD